MKSIISLILIALISSASSCENPFVERVYSFWIQNNSIESISVSYSLLFPDTTITHIPRYKVVRIGPGEKRPIDSSDAWEKVINDIPGKKLQVYVFDVIVDDSNWDSVKTNYLVRERYELSVEQLKSMNWIVTYP